MTKRGESFGPDSSETGYIRAMSRPMIIEAYEKWQTASRAEQHIMAAYLPENPRVLDLGCGAGRMLDVFSHKFREYIGVDGSEEMLRAARKKHADAVFILGNIVELEPGDAKYDAVLLMHNVLDSLRPSSRRSELLITARETLEPDGVLICSSHVSKSGQEKGYFDEDYHGAIVSNYRSSASEFSSEVEGAGFEVIFMMRDIRETIMDWNYIVAQRKQP